MRTYHYLLIIDNRTNQPSDISHAVAITIIGTATEELENRESLTAVFLGRHSQLWQFAGNPDNAIIRVNVSSFIISGFDTTQYIAVE